MVKVFGFCFLEFVRWFVGSLYSEFNDSGCFWGGREEKREGIRKCGMRDLNFIIVFFFVFLVL